MRNATQNTNNGENKMKNGWIGTMPAAKAHFDGSRFTMWTKASQIGESVVLRKGRKFVAFFASEDGSFTREKTFNDLESAKKYAEQTTEVI
jgi:hypothetical protein